MRITLSELEAFPDSVIISGLAMNRSVYIDNMLLDAGPSFKVKRICPTFDWGYKGSAPGQLALAILFHYLDDTEGKILEDETHTTRGMELSKYLYEAFKITFIAQLPQDNFTVKVRLRDFIIALAALNEKPVAAASLVEAMPFALEIPEIRVNGLSGGTRNLNDVIVAGMVKNKVSIAQTGENSYDIKGDKDVIQ